MTSRRQLILAASAALMLPASAGASAPVFYRNPGCGCCHKWTLAMADAGMPVELKDVDDLAAEHSRLGVPGELQGCHVGEIGGYVISGHVPPADIKRLLAERPGARGLAVPGMPVGSPGMEYAGQLDPYAVLLFQDDGSVVEFARYG